MNHNWYIVMTIIHGEVYSLLKLTSKRAPFVYAYDVTSNPIVMAEGSVGEHWLILP